MDLEKKQRGGKESGGFLTAPFVIAVVLLGSAGLLTGPVAARLNLRMNKSAIPMKKPLNTLDVTALAPYGEVERHVLDDPIVEALGTDQYISWTLQDLSLPVGDPLRWVSLLVTYDTGGHNLVPHTPDECRLGSGYQPAQPHENLRFPASQPAGGSREFPVRVCTFAKTAVFNRENVTVVYTFHCNGQFAATRDHVRLLFNAPRSRHAYFSKVEVSFPRATREQSLTGAKKLMDRLLPELAAKHWPDYEAAERGVSP